MKICKINGKDSSLKLIILFSLITLFIMYISMGEMIKLPIPNIFNKMINTKNYILCLIFASVLHVIWGFDIIKNGLKNIIHKMPNMDSLVGIGVIVNFTYSFINSILAFKGNTSLINNLYFDASCMIILFIKIGRYIDKKNKEKAIDTIKNLVTITPKNATILENGKEKKVTINEIQKGDTLICKPGEKIAVDGVIIKGKTHTDESFLTGESKPVSKQEDSNVMAGSINYDGYIEYEAQNIGKDSYISHIVDLVVEATNTKAPISRLADRISRYFVPGIFIIAIISFILNLIIAKNFTSAIIALVSVLVVACPCSLGLATPLAMVISIGNASKKGILIKSSESLEAINKIDTVVFDKTGTLTKGNLSIVDLKEQELKKDIKYNLEDKLKILKSLEKYSNHPIAKSICKDEMDLYKVENFKEISGKGIEGIINGTKYFAGNQKLVNEKNIQNVFEEQEKEYSEKGESIIYLGNEEELLLIIGLADEIKDSAQNTIINLKNRSKKVIMLTGDNENTAKTIAKKINIEEIYSNVSPQEKLEKIKELNNKQNCLMVGDGINDSPALKTATIGVSVAGGTDISSDSADIILLNEDINKINDLFLMGEKTIKIIKQNLFWALFYNMLMIPIATGLLCIKLNPMIASLAMTISSLTVVLNSLRLKK